MKKKRYIRILLWLLCVVMLCSIPAYAVEIQASSRIAHSTASLSKKSDGDLSVYFSVRASDIMEKIGASSVKIQRSSDGKWVTEYTFTVENTPEIQATDETQYSAILTYSPLFADMKYRAVVTIYVEDASGSSTKLLTSKTV